MRAQDACIAALEPVSKDERPSPEALRSAARSAEAAAREDRRWLPLRQRVEEFRSQLGAGHLDPDPLAQECRRVNQIVKDERDDV